MNHQETRNLIAFVIHAWPSVPWRNDDSKPLIAAWQTVLADIELSEATAVLVGVARAGAEFPPTPGVLAKAVLDMRDVRSGRRAPDPDEAWAEIQRAISSHGYMNGPPDWSHPAVDAVVSALTWRELCLGTNHDTMRAHFLRLYTTAVERVVRNERIVARTALDQPRHIGELPQ